MSTMPENEIRAGFLRHRATSDVHRAATKSTNDEYLRHRAGSLIHHYFSLLEDPSHPVDEFAELFTAPFHLDFTMAQIATFADFTSWLESTRKSVAALTLSVSELEVSDDAGNACTASMNIELDAIGHDGDRKEMSTRHVWTLHDQAEDRFPRIESMVVTLRT